MSADDSSIVSAGTVLGATAPQANAPGQGFFLKILEAISLKESFALYSDRQILRAALALSGDYLVAGGGIEGRPRKRNLLV